MSIPGTRTGCISILEGNKCLTSIFWLVSSTYKALSFDDKFDNVIQAETQRPP